MHSRIQALVIRQISKQLYNRPWDQQLSARLRDDLGLDSLDEMELLNRLEDTFHIQLNDDEVCDFRTVADVVRCVERYVRPQH